MIEEFARLVPDSIRSRSGKVFYAGRDAFSGRKPLYLLGINPGGDPDGETERIVQRDIEFVLHETPSKWSAYADEEWVHRPAGLGGIQPQVLRLLAALRIDPRQTPSSNLFFVRSRKQADLKKEEASLIATCWPFHNAVIHELGIKVVVCMGKFCGDRVRFYLRANDKVDEFVEDNDRRWRSELYKGPSGIYVASLTSPSWAHWSNPSIDPSPLVARAIRLADAF